MTTVDLNGIRETIKKLEEFMRLASDPAIAPYVHLNGNRPTATTNSGVDTSRKITPRSKTSGLTTAVLDACKTVQGKFTVNTIYDYLTKAGFGMESGNPKKAIGHVLRTLAREGRLRIVEKGAGKKAVVYAL